MATEDQIRDFERKWWGLLLCRMWEQWQNESTPVAEPLDAESGK